MGNLKSEIKILCPSRIYRSLDRLKSLRIGPAGNSMPPIRSLAQLVFCAGLLPAAILIIIATVAFQTALSASILDDAPAPAPATTNKGQTGIRLASFPKAENSRNVSISLNGENPLKVECGETFSDPGATAINGTGKTVPVQVSGKVDTATLGTYTLTYTAADDKDTASVERTVTVIDTTPPQIFLKGGKTMTVTCGELFAEPGASAVDSCQGVVPLTISGSVDSNIQGRYTITYTAVDASNNTQTVGRDVIVGSLEDNPPTIKIDGPAQITIECGSLFTDAGATASTPCSGSTPVVASGVVDVQAPGDYVIKYKASSGELAAEKARLISVVDTTAPQISLKGDNPLTIELRQTFTDPGATARDGCAGEVAVTASGTVDQNKIGSYTITYTASDPSENEAIPVQRTVNVVERTQPPADSYSTLTNLFRIVCRFSAWGNAWLV
jgi:hypothetical protein